MEKVKRAIGQVLVRNKKACLETYGNIEVNPVFAGVSVSDEIKEAVT